VQNEALFALPRSWRRRLAGWRITPIAAGMSGAPVFHVASGSGNDLYLKIGMGRFGDLVKREIERTAWLASLGVRVPEIVARLIERDVVAALMTDLGCQTANQIEPTSWHAPVQAIGRAFGHLHALSLESCPFDETLDVRLARAAQALRAGDVDPADFDPRNRGLTPDELYGRLLARPPDREDCVIVHGDADLSNLILGDDGRVGFIDCGNAGKADRYIDLALVVRDLEERFGAEARSAFMQGYGPLPWDSGKADYYRDLYEFF
jgi:aminoglycoside phosphotransferase